MQKSTKQKKLLYLKIQELINQKFNSIGDFLGDILCLLELSYQQDNPNLPLGSSQIQLLLDQHAEEVENILGSHKTSLIKALNAFMEFLILDLQKIKRPHLILVKK